MIVELMDAIFALQATGGGPLTCQSPEGRYVQAGVSVTYVGEAIAEIPLLYADVSKVRGWIDKVMLKHGLRF